MLPGPVPRERLQPVARQDGQVLEGVRSVQQGRVVCGRGRNPTFSPLPRHGPPASGCKDLLALLPQLALITAFWETAVLFHLRDAFRAGDVWLARSRRYGDIRKALLSAPAIADADRSLPAPASPHDWLAERRFR